MAARRQESGRAWTQQRSWTPGFDAESVSNQRRGDRARKSKREMRPWRSAAARRRWDEEGSVERRSRRGGRGVQRTEVTNGERELELEGLGEGRGRVEMSWRERESTTEIELPEAKARRPEELRSADPKLLRFGGPGSVQSHESWPAAARAALGLDIAAFSVVVEIPSVQRSV
jgi:hypothetical protein